MRHFLHTLWFWCELPWALVLWGTVGGGAEHETRVGDWMSEHLL